MRGRFVLVHSPLTGPSVWEAVARVLSRQGHEVAVPSLEEHPQDEPYWRRHAAAPARVLRDHPGGVVVAHSGAGALMAAVADLAGSVAGGYVFVDAVLPSGRSRLDDMAGDDPAFADELRRHLEAGGRFPEWTLDDLAEIVPDANARARLCADLRPRGLDYFTEPIPSFEGWPDRGCAYMRLSAPYDPAAREAGARGWPVRRLDCGHFHPLVDPEEVAGIVAEVAEGLRS